MPRKLNILVLGVGGNVSQGILRALAVSNLEYRLIGACISAESLGLYLCDAAYISPYATDAEFIPWLLDLCHQERIDIILTGVEEIIDELVINAETIHKETGAVFVSSSESQINIGRDKLRTCEWLRQNDCAFPMFAASEDSDNVQRLVDECGFPLIAKPRNGKGSHGVRIINEYSEFDDFFYSNVSHYVIEQYIGDNDSEYTVACYCDKNGSLIDLITMKRTLGFGATMKAEVVQNDLIRKESVKICEAFKPVGPLNIQMRLDRNGVPVCFEINVRFSGTVSMRARFGFNDVEALIREHIYNENVNNSFVIKSGIAYRYWNEIFTDKDDRESLMNKGRISTVNRTTNYVDGYRGK